MRDARKERRNLGRRRRRRVAGVVCAKQLAKHNVAVTLVDQNNYSQFQPMLYQVATAQIVSDATWRGRCAGSSASGSSVAREDGDRHRGRRVGQDRHLRRRHAASPATTSCSRWAPGRTSSARPAPRSTRSRCTRSADAQRLRSRIFTVFEDADRNPKLIDDGALELRDRRRRRDGCGDRRIARRSDQRRDARAVPRPRHVGARTCT